MICWLIKQAIHPTVVEADRGNSTVANIFQNSTLVKLIFAYFSENEDKISKADPIILEAGEGKQIIVNLPGQVHHNGFDEWFIGDEIHELANDMNIALNHFFVSNGSFESLSIYQEIMENIGNAFYIKALVINEFNRSESWQENLNQFDDVFRKYKTKIIEMPKLRAGTYELVRNYNLSFEEATLDTRLNIVERQRVKTFLNKNYAQLEQFKRHFSI